MLAWPRKCCRSVMSIPRASSRVATVCRSRWGQTACDLGRTRHFAHDLADALAGQGVRHRAEALLAAGEQRSGPAGADVQPEQLGQLAADRHLAPLAALALANDHDALGKADILDPQLDQLGSPQAGFEQGLQHQPGSAVPGIGLIEKAQLRRHREAVHAAAAFRRRP